MNEIYQYSPRMSFVFNICNSRSTYFKDNSDDFLEIWDLGFLKHHVGCVELANKLYVAGEKMFKNIIPQTQKI